MGPRDARRLDDRRRRRLARAAVARRAGPRSTRRPVPIGRAFGDPRRDCSRPTSRRSRPTSADMLGPAGPGRASRRLARELADVVLHPPLGARSRHRPWPPIPAGGLRLDAVAVGRPAAAARSATTTASPGARASGSSSAWLVRRLARLAPDPAARLPPDAAGARRRPADGVGAGRAPTKPDLLAGQPGQRPCRVDCGA